MKINSSAYRENFINFVEIFKNMPCLTENPGKNYTDLFKSDTFSYKCTKSFIRIPNTHYVDKNFWLIKPTDLCGGRCIKISDNLEDIEKMVKKFSEGLEKSLKKSVEEDMDDSDGDSNEESKGKLKSIKYRTSTVLLQKYIEKPLLYNGRKFDIRMWVLITHKLEVYVFKYILYLIYREGHLKTTSTEYRMDTKDKLVHITNYSLQKYSNNFNKFEEGNEVAFKDLQVA